jgi:hypothetical protein
MILRAFAILAGLAIAFLASGEARAQTVVARSGEHDGFSRLVMRLPDGADWSLTQSGRSATLNIGAPNVVYDTSRVFDLIPRDRLAAIRQTAPGQPLRMDLGCNCEIRSYVLSNGYLVIDIRDGNDQPVYASNGSGAPFLPSAPLAAIEQPGAGYRFNLGQQAVADARLALDMAAAIARNAPAYPARPVPGTPAPAAGTAGTAALSSAETRPAAAPEQPRKPALLPLERLAEAQGLPAPDAVEANMGAVTEGDDLPEVNLLLDMEESARAATVNASEQRLLQQIGRAANQGLLDMAIADAQIDTSARQLNPLGRDGRPLDPLANIMITSAIDREAGLISRATEDSEPEFCLPDGTTAIYTWGNDSPFAEQLGPLRGALVQEFDDVNPATVMSLAKLYLFFGFGSEAKAMLNILPADRIAPQTKEIMMALADLVDGNTLPINHVFSGQQICEGNSPLWAVLADGTIKKGANSDAIQQAFGRLPGHMRVHLGPRLSSIFAEAGDSHVAEAILRAVSRTGVEDVPEMNMAEAAIADLAGDTETMAEKLTEEVTDRTENTPVALIELVALSYKERKALSPDVPDLIGSYEHENKDGELGARLRQAQIAALALTGRFHDAFQELKAVTKDDGPAARAQALDPLMTLLTERADDVTFLQYALVFAKQSTATEAAPVADLIARRLLDLGFADQAMSLLKKLALEPENEDRRLMLAEAALAQNKPQQALVELMGLDGTEANRLRAQALWRNGEYGRSGEYMQVAQDANQAMRGFWHSEDLEAIQMIEPEADAPFRQVADMTTEIGETAKDPEGLTPLAHARALVESSQGTRGGIEELLNQLSASGAASQ